MLRKENRWFPEGKQLFPFEKDTETIIGSLKRKGNQSWLPLFYLTLQSKVKRRVLKLCIARLLLFYFVKQKKHVSLLMAIILRRRDTGIPGYRDYKFRKRILKRNNCCLKSCYFLLQDFNSNHGLIPSRFSFG